MNTSAIVFTLGEISTYYATRVPALKQGRAAQWRGPCPIHKGQNDNFAVEAETGLWCCHSKCGQRGGDILGLEQALNGGDFPSVKAEVFRLVGRIELEYRHYDTRANGTVPGTAPTEPTKLSDEPGALREVERYPYVDRDGDLLFEVVRYINGEGGKEFRQRRPDGQGGWEWNIHGVNRVPFHLSAILNSTEPIFLVEGEKDVHTLESWGAVASCNPGGCGSSRLYEQWADYFRGRGLVILPDNDGPGRKHVAAVTTALLPVAASIRIVELPDLGEKGDVTDWRDAGGTFERLWELAQATEPLDAAALTELRARWGLADEPGDKRPVMVTPLDWPTPEPIESELPAVQPFEEDLLPESFRSQVAEMAERMQVPADFPAAVMILCLGGAVNRRATIQPKAADNSWKIVANLWGAIVAPPGFLKSPVINAATHPLNELQSQWRDKYEAAMKDYRKEKTEYDIRHTAWKELYKAAFKKNQTPPGWKEEEPLKPILQRIIVNDATFEALHQTMSENPDGVLAIRDEIVGWWNQLDRAGREGERAFCLQAWNGDTGYTIDRIGRGTVHVDACCMSMLGGIQPGRLRSYLTEALEDGPSNDGLIQRFQILVWPDTESDWEYVDRPPDPVLEERAAQAFRTLLEMKPVQLGFAPAAQELFVTWLADLEAKIRGTELHPALISHLSKYRKLMPTLALLFELADAAAFSRGIENVSLHHARQAAVWCEYLESHARRVYSCVVTPQMRAARELADKIRQRKVGGNGAFSCRDVYLKGWSGLDSPEAVKLAADVLKDARWVRDLASESGPLGGRPSNRYAVNPGVWR